ncbi:MAG: MBOAT family protein [Bacteroidia bacterium]|nr:MBOAT family protein [Bacteroidia bacterium]
MKNIFILIFSIFFYSWGGPKFIFAILLTTFLDFHFAKFMHRSEENKKKIWLWLSVCMNVGLLVYFKYLVFFRGILNDVFGAGLEPMKIALPVGISFYTFESITYLVDVYRKIHPPLKSFLDYQTYILLFPKLIAGPIVRYHEIAGQMDPMKRNENYALRLSGLSIFMIGLAKKCLLANTLGAQADAVFNLKPEELDTSAAWVGILAYTLQIYFDFSGYSDMAVGLCRIMGFIIPDNFLNPYTSGSITEFWRKWHITLGRWMKHYLYIPLGGNRLGKFRTFFNLWLVFLISGLWHGAGWNFIFWGAWHGLFLVMERWTGEERFMKIPNFIRWPYMFMVVMCGWVFFRADNMEYGIKYLQTMFSFSGFDGKFAMQNDFVFMACAGLFFALFIWLPKGKEWQDWWWNSDRIFEKLKLRLALMVIFYLLSLSFLTSLNFNPFIYFRF